MSPNSTSPTTQSDTPTASSALAVQPDTSTISPASTPSPSNNPVLSSDSAPAKKPRQPLVKSGSFWLTIAMGIFGIAGIIIGVIGTISASEAMEQKETTENELAEAQRTIYAYATKLGLNADENGQPIPEENTNNSTSTSSKNYIYIGEWGMKIKIPKSLKDVSYAFYNNLMNNASSVCITGTPSGVTSTPEFAQLQYNPNGLGCISRETGNNFSYDQQQTKWDGKYYYYYYHPQAVFSTDEQEQEWEIQATELIQTSLKNPDNLTTF